MVFGFFTKRPQQAVDSPLGTNIPLPASPTPAETPLPSSSKVIYDEITETDVQQLRTPSPSIDTASIARGPQPIPSPAPTTANNSSYSSIRQLSEPSFDVLPTPVAVEPPQPSLLPTSESITKLVATVPAKILHSYVLEQLPSASTATLESLCSFFNTLAPPPKLHCVRCHKDYVDVENEDRSCLVPHDDESAEVERVGRSGEARRTKVGTEYETLWGCCGKTTEGDGSEGPPEGWCYEGKHTTDIKRARFRADSTLQDDKLVSCLRLNCHGIRSRTPRASTSTRKRARKTYKEVSDEEDGSEGEADSGIEEIAGKAKEKVRRKSGVNKGKEKEKTKEDEAARDDAGLAEDKMDVDQDVEQAGRAGSPREKVTTPISAPLKRRGRPPKSKPVNSTDGSSAVAVTPTPKRRGRPPKNKAVVPDESDAGSRNGRKPSLSPVRQPEKGPTRSASRGRVSTAVGRLEAEQSSRSLGLKKPKSRKAAEHGDEDIEMEEDKPAKKRKITE